MRLGLFGGTFDPVHNLHLFVAETARVELGLERVIFLPTNGSAHYREAAQAAAEDRVAMLRLAIASNVHFALDESDLEPGASGLTADLLPHLRRRYPHASLVFIAGSDSVLEAPWRRFDEVLAQLDAFAIVPRSGHAEGLASLDARFPPAARARFVVLDVPPQADSATIVRAQAARGRSVRYLVPDAVARYIEERGLFRIAGR